MDDFVSLADVLRPRARDDAAPADPNSGETPTGAGDSEDAASTGPGELVEAVREARMFRARLADAFDDARVRLLRELATDVLARELRIAPCDLDVLARRALASAPVVRIRVAPSEIGLVSGIPVVADPDLAEGDAIVELDGGTIDARLGARLALVLEAFA
ncbi:MAG TPA: FliH/SctL family protein [Candidatus Elarobacter sp.]|jgi:hypothetical protein|nr:FliH/SctL family protein [Candidatus Elarobacter sp.]